MGVSHTCQGVDPLAVVVYGGNQPVFVAADIEHHNWFSTSDLNLVGGWKLEANIREAIPTC